MSGDFAYTNRVDIVIVIPMYTLEPFFRRYSQLRLCFVQGLRRNPMYATKEIYSEDHGRFPMTVSVILDLV